MTATKTELKKLEQKVNLLSKAMHMLLFAEKEELPKKETQEIKKRLSAYLKGKKDEFVNLENVAYNTSRKNMQKHSKRDY